MSRNTAQTIPLQAVADLSIPEAKKELVLDADEIKRLREIKLLTSVQYFYFASLASYRQSNPSVDRHWFCDEWDIEPENFDLLLAQLDKKGVIRKAKYEEYVQLSLFETPEAK